MGLLLTVPRLLQANKNKNSICLYIQSSRFYELQLALLELSATDHRMAAAGQARRWRSWEANSKGAPTGAPEEIIDLSRGQELNSWPRLTHSDDDDDDQLDRDRDPMAWAPAKRARLMASSDDISLVSKSTSQTDAHEAFGRFKMEQLLHRQFSQFSTTYK